MSNVIGGENGSGRTVAPFIHGNREPLSEKPRARKRHQNPGAIFCGLLDYWTSTHQPKLFVAGHKRSTKAV